MPLKLKLFDAVVSPFISICVFRIGGAAVDQHLQKLKIMQRALIVGWASMGRYRKNAMKTNARIRKLSTTWNRFVEGASSTLVHYPFR